MGILRVLRGVFVLALMLAPCLLWAAGEAEASTDVESPVTLTCWYPFTSEIIANAADSIVFQEKMNRTGINIEFVHPPEGQAQEQFNLMIASDDLTDIIRNPRPFPGGPEKALDDDYYVDLAPLLEEQAPNIHRVINSDPEIRRQSFSDTGRMWGVPQIQLAEEPPWSGPWVRSDWLENLGLSMPETIDEWEQLLTVFRDQVEGVEAPLIVQFNWTWNSNSAFAGAYGAGFGDNSAHSHLWLNKDGRVVFGPSEPGYRDFLGLMNSWYEMGLLDEDFATRDGKSWEAMITSGRAGAIVAAYGSIGPWLAAGRSMNPEFSLAPAPMPVVNKGDELHIRNASPNIRDNRGVVTAACENVPVAMEWFDYNFTDEGFLLMCYGVEGVSYTMEPMGDFGFDADFFPRSIRAGGEKPMFTDFMVNNPDGIDFWDLVGHYKVHNGPMLRNPMSYVMAPEAVEAMQIWGEAGSDWVMPPISLTEAESSRYAQIMADVQTYYTEMTLKFIMGLEPLRNYNAYLSQLEALSVGEARDIRQAALDRYMSR